MSHDAVIVGSGPNGLAAAIALARAGRSVLVLERDEEIGGSCRTVEATIPGFRHDRCAAVHPLAAASPLFGQLPLERHGLRWVHSPAPLAHPLDHGEAVVLERSLEETAAGLGDDGCAWVAMMGPLLRGAATLISDVLGPPLAPRPAARMARFARDGLRSCAGLVSRFRDARARALFAGCAAHSVLPLDAAGSAAFGMVLALAGHHAGWPCVEGGSGRLIDALAAHLESLGGRIDTGREVRSLGDVPSARVVLFDTSPAALARIAGGALPAGYRRRLLAFPRGPGAFKVDWALAAPIPWRAPACRRALTVHVGGTFEEIAAAEDTAANGAVSDRPFIILAQHSLFDATRAPGGQQTAWAYCHVPNGATVDMTDRIERQIERFAPGFRDVILARRSSPPSALEASNPNLVGGDISGGANDLRHLLFRPVVRRDPYSTPNPRLFLCSSSTPPGGGVHGMCGYWAALSALKRLQ